jgi:hypothetical protein
MLGHLIKQNEQWMVKYDDSGTNKIYPLCVETQKWTQKPEIKNFLKENIEVVFDFIVRGEYCETKEEMIKNYFAKIKRIEHESL